MVNITDIFNKQKVYWIWPTSAVLIFFPMQWNEPNKATNEIETFSIWIFFTDETLNQAGYAVFSPGEPNNAEGHEYCGSVGRNGKLFDDPCLRNMLYICEKRTNEIDCDENDASIVDEENEVVVLDENKKAKMLRNLLIANNS